MEERIRHLYVLRHAKSSWDDPELADHERPLAERGREAAQLLSEHLQREGIEPELVICSAARRAQETLERVDPTCERSLEDALYGASAGDWIERLKRVPDGLRSVIVIGHNPALQKLVLALGGPDRAVEDKFPTAALAHLTFACQWSELQPGCATLAGVVRPKDLI